MRKKNGASTRRWMFLALGSVLLIGTSLGVLADRLVFSGEGTQSGRAASGEIWFDCSREPQPRPEAEKEEQRVAWVAEIRDELLLDEPQSDRVRQMLQVHGDGARSFWYETRAEYCGLVADLRADVAELLTPEQKVRFTARLARIDEEMRRQRQETGRD